MSRPAAGSSSSFPTPYQPRMPVKQKMALSLKSLMTTVLSAVPGSGVEGPSSTSSSSAAGGGGGGGAGAAGPARMEELFAKTDPATDGDDCLRDCDGCAVRYPRNWKVDEDDLLYGHVTAWSTHALVATGKADWVRDVADEKGSVMEAIKKADAPTNGKLMLSASNIPTPHDTTDYSEPTTVLLLPAFTLIHNVHPRNVPVLIRDLVNHAPTNTSPLRPWTTLPASLPSPGPEDNADPAAIPALLTAACPHSAVILMCSQRTRDVRCGQSAPLLRKELERHLRPLGLHRDMHDERPGGVGIYFISHVGGHKYSANVMIYRRPNAFGQDDEPLPAGVEEKAAAPATEEQKNGHNGSSTNGSNGATNGNSTNGHKAGAKDDVGAAQCIWLGRVRPEDCENLVRYTILKGKVVKPEKQLRGGFDRSRGLFSW